MGSPYRPLPSSPRMRWTVVPGHSWSYAYLAWAWVGAASVVTACVVAGAPWWLYFIEAVWLAPLVGAARMRLVRVPVEPTQMRVAVLRWFDDGRVHRDFVEPLMEFEAGLRAARDTGAAGPDDGHARREDRHE